MPIGQILVAAGVVSPADLRRALKYQDEHPGMTLGSVLILLNITTAAKIEAALGRYQAMQAPDDKKLDMEDVMRAVQDVSERSEELAASAELLAYSLQDTVHPSKR